MDFKIINSKGKTIAYFVYEIDRDHFFDCLSEKYEDEEFKKG